jgi:DNA-binding beta-propeller fold protein YncE
MKHLLTRHSRSSTFTRGPAAMIFLNCFRTAKQAVWLLIFGLCLLAIGRTAAAQDKSATEVRRLLYVAVPGVRNYLEYGGHGLLVFDIDHGHKFVKRIPTAGLDEAGKPLNVKGVCANAQTRRIYISTIKTLTCLDLVSEQILWEKAYEGGCDRMSISPDGKVIYLPSFEQDHWHVVDAISGGVIAKIVPKSGAHNTVVGLDGKSFYLAGLKSPLLTVADTATHAADHTVGPFSASIRPFTVNGAQSLCFVNVNDLLGFEVGDLKTGKMLHRVEVPGYKKGPVKRHGCPSHGIGLTPDEKELWVTDAANRTMHVFDNTVMPPKIMQHIKVRDEPGWITFSLNGRYAYPSTGDVIDTTTKQILLGLTDEMGRAVGSEKLLEIDFEGTNPIRNGDQFGVGRVVSH